MIRINLLPHRQIKRAERQRQFTLMLLATLVAAAALVFLGHTLISTRIEGQTARNSRLDTAIAKLDKDIAEIKELKGKISDVLERKQVVENLQTNRSQTVTLLDEIARKLPDGMSLKSIKQQGNLITLEGVADSNAKVATLVRNLSSSEWLESPGLIEIKAEMVSNLKRNNFTLNVTQKVQKLSDAETGSKKSKGKKL
jgi:type IV pilus assembly protein PilN